MKRKLIILFLILLLILTSCDSVKNKENLTNEMELLKTENELLKEKINKLEKQIEDLEKTESVSSEQKIKLPDEEDGEIDLEVLIQEYFLNGKVSFSIETNLPNNTEAIVTLENDKDYLAQDKVIIYGGRAATAYFSDEMSPLPVGNYTVEFVLPHSQAQPEDVQKVLGNDYENLISDKKEKDKYGVSISIIKEINITEKTTD